MNHLFLKPDKEIGSVDRRNKFYLLFLLFHFITFVLGPVGISLADSSLIPLSSAQMGLVWTVTILILNIIIYRLMSLFIYKIGLYFYATTTILLILGNFIMNLPASPIDPAMTYNILVVTNICVFVQVIMINFVIFHDIFFRLHNKLNYKLLAAANAYWVLGSFFACVYALLETFIPGVLGIPGLAPSKVFTTAYAFSFYNLVSIESQMNSLVHISITNFAVLEGIVSSLFIIFVVGKLLSKE